MLVMPWLSSVSPPSANTLTGISCAGCARFCAVTTISSTASAWLRWPARRRLRSSRRPSSAARCAKSHHENRSCVLPPEGVAGRHVGAVCPMGFLTSESYVRSPTRRKQICDHRLRTAVRFGPRRGDLTSRHAADSVAALKHWGQPIDTHPHRAADRPGGHRPVAGVVLVALRPPRPALRTAPPGRLSSCCWAS